MTWTEARIVELTELWECNCPTAEIARIMGLTKNAVIGKAHRLELSPRPSPIIRFDPVAKPKKPRRAPVWTADRNARLTTLYRRGDSCGAIAEDLGLPVRSVRGQLSRLGLSRDPSRKPQKKERPARLSPRQPIPRSRVRTCQFIEGTPTVDDACKCGEPAQVGSSYCPEHHARCWRSVGAKQDTEPFHQVGRKRRFGARA